LSRVEVAAQGVQTARGLRLDGAHGHAEGVGGLLFRQITEIAKGDDLPLPTWQPA
jgi:hypothetical protein